MLIIVNQNQRALFVRGIVRSKRICQSTCASITSCCRSTSIVNILETSFKAFATDYDRFIDRCTSDHYVTLLTVPRGLDYSAASAGKQWYMWLKEPLRRNDLLFLQS